MTNGRRTLLSDEDMKQCFKFLKECEMFHRLSDDQIEDVAKVMNVQSIHRDQIFINQGVPVTAFYLVKDGEVHRDFLDPDTGKRHVVEFEIKSRSINSMRVLSGDAAQSTVKCVKTDCTVYEMARQRFLNVLFERPDIGVGIANSLSTHVRDTSKKYKMPLDQRRQLIQNMPAIMIAAGIESYYRSALNSQINRALTGIKSELFPNMHIQVPMRIAYIAGFKGLRTIIDQYKDDDDDESTIQQNSPTYFNNAATKNFFLNIAPGVIMTPLSSVLEASNVGHLNKEPMATRWTRGVVARCGREIIFGLGLNQLSDYFQKQLKFEDSPMLGNMIGSMMSGVVSGYLSHVPHILSTYKLIEPHRSYADLYRNVFVERSVPPFLERYLSRHHTQSKNTGATVVAGNVNYSTAQQAVRFVAATIFPRGLIVRTAQIVGSFIILNGTINYFTLMQQQQ